MQNTQATQATDTSMIDIYINVIKEKLAEKEINLNFETQTQAEKLVTQHIEDKLCEIIKFLQ